MDQSKDEYLEQDQPNAEGIHRQNVESETPNFAEPTVIAVGTINVDIDRIENEFNGLKYDMRQASNLLSVEKPTEKVLIENEQINGFKYP